MKIGDKIRITHKYSLFYGEIIELVKIDDDYYYFTNDKHIRGHYCMKKDCKSGYELLERESNAD